jgi:hypothetical protein
MLFIQENQITRLKKKSYGSLSKPDTTGTIKMQYINRKKQTQIFDEYKTYSTEPKRINKNTQTG